MWQKRPLQARAADFSPEAAAPDALNGKILLFWVLAIAVAGLFLLNVAAPPAELTARFTIDDSYYYFEAAWRTRLDGFVTFDGIHATNGVHFLWFTVLLAVAWLAPGKMFFLYAVYGVSLLLVLAVYWGIWRVGTLVGDRSRLLTVVMGLIWTFLLSDRINLFFVGMESTLHMALLWGVLAVGLMLLREADGTGRLPGRTFLVFTLLLVLVTWTRLDSALFALALYLYAVGRMAWRLGPDGPGFRRYLAWSVAIAGAGAAVQIGFFYLAAGTVLPISALVKATGIGPEIEAGLWERIMSVVFPMTTFVKARTPLHLAVEAALFAALLGFAVRRALARGTTRATEAAPALRHLYGFAAALGAATVVYAVIVGPSHDPFWRWYLAPVYLFYILTVGCALCEARRSLDWPPLRRRAVGASAAVLLALFFMVLFFASHLPTPHYQMRTQLGLFLKEVTAADDVLAAFNAGQVAFFSERRTVNLDGLANDRHYFDTVLGRPEALIASLRENDVRYLVDYDFYWASEAIESATTVRYAFPIPGDRFERVLYVREVGRGE